MDLVSANGKLRVAHSEETAARLRLWVSRHQIAWPPTLSSSPNRRPTSTLLGQKGLDYA